MFVMNSMGNIDHLSWFIGILSICSLVYYHDTSESSISTTIIALVAGGAVPLTAIACTWCKHRYNWNDRLIRTISIRRSTKRDTQIAIAHSGVNLFISATLLPFVHHIARWLSKIT